MRHLRFGRKYSQTYSLIIILFSLLYVKLIRVNSLLGFPTFHKEMPVCAALYIFLAMLYNIASKHL